MRVLPRVLLSTLVLVPAAVLPAGFALAGTQDGAVVALHAGPHTMKGDTPCDYTDGEPPVPCRDFTTTWPLNVPANVYLVVARGDPDPGFGALSFGIRYNNGELGGGSETYGVGADVYSWSLCVGHCGPDPPPDPGDPDDFPASGGGLRLVWWNCSECSRSETTEDGVHAVVGSFYVYAYSDDLFEVTPNYDVPGGAEELAVGDCDAQLTDLPYPEAAGAVAFGSGTGRNPCRPVPVEPVTWSRLKARYGRSDGGTP